MPDTFDNFTDDDLQLVSADPSGSGSIDEGAFRNWYSEHAQANGLNPNPDAPEHHYDYRAAYSAGATPDPETGHWPSEFKAPDHPNRYVDGIDTITGQRADWSDSDLRPVAAPYESSAGLRQRLAFNLQNDYAPDQGNLYDQAILGVGEGLAGIPGAIGGLSRFVQAPGFSDLGSRLSRYSQDKIASYEDLGDTLGTSPAATMARGTGETVAGLAPFAVAGTLSGPAGFAAVGGLQSLGSTENEAAAAYEQQGLTPEQATAKARIPATLAGAASAAINYFVPGGAKALLDKLTEGILSKTAVQMILKESLNNALALGGMSASDTAAQGIIAKATYDPERTLKDIAMQSLESGAAGAGLGLAMGGAHEAAKGITKVIRSGLTEVGKSWEKMMDDPSWQFPDQTPTAPPPDIGPRPLDSTDAPRVKLAGKILKAAGYDPDFATPFSESFASLFDPSNSWDGEAYRNAMLQWLDANGVRPIESVGKKADRRQAQSDWNAQALENLQQQARTTPLRTAPVTEAGMPRSTAEAPSQPAAQRAASEPIAAGFGVRAAESANLPLSLSRAGQTQTPVPLSPQSSALSPIENLVAPAQTIAGPTGPPETHTVVQAAQPLPSIPPIHEIKPAPAPDWEASTPVEGVKISGHYDVVDAGTLVTSFDKGFDQSLQPRDRSRSASQQQILDIANRLDPQRLGESPTTDFGAPIIDENNHVLSGNGRAASLRKAFERNGPPAVGYSAWLIQNANQFGIDPAKIAAMQNPVLVRRVSDLGGLTKQQFAEQSNRQQVLGRGEAESAAADARMILSNPQLIENFRPSEDGDVLAASNRDFLKAFIQGSGDQASLLSKEGFNGPVLRKRVRKAILGAIIGPENRHTLTALLERGEELGVSNAVNGMMTAAPSLARLVGGQYDLTAPLAKAAQDLIRVKSEGSKVEDFLAQNDLFGDPIRSAESDLILSQIANAKSARAVAEPLAVFAQRALKIDTATPDIFGATNPTRGEILKGAYESTAQPTPAPQENFAFGKSSTLSAKSNAARKAPHGSIQNDTAQLGSAQEPSPSPSSQPAVSATGPTDIHAALLSRLSPEHAAATLKALSILEANGFPTEKLTVEISSLPENGLAGSVLGNVIRLTESADPSVGPEEVMHIAIAGLPEADRSALEAERVANLPADAPPEIRAGTMTTAQFRDSGLDKKYYPFINLDEYAAQNFGRRIAEETAARKRGLWQRIKDWFSKLWTALRNLVKDPAASDKIFKDLGEGRATIDVEKAIQSDIERGKFVTSQTEAKTAADLAKGVAAKKIEGEEFLAQVDVPVKLMEKHGVQNLPPSIRRSFGYTESKGIQQIGELHNGQPEDYYAIRARSPGWVADRLGAMANTHALRFKLALERVATDGADALTELNSPAMQERIRKMQSAFVSALFHEQAFKNAQIGIKTALNQATELLKQQGKTDLETATLEGEIRMLNEVAASRVAMERLLDDMIATLLSTPEGKAILQNGGLPRDISAIYRDLKRSTNQTVTNDQLIGVASFLLSRMAELRNQLLASHFAKQSGPLAAARARLKTLLDQLEKAPAATLERMMRTRENLSANATAAEFIYRQMEKELTRELDPLYDRIKGGNIARDILGDPDFHRYSADVSVHGKSYNGKPFEPFVQTLDAPGGEIITPSGKVAGLGTDLMTANPTLIRKRYHQATNVIKELDDWIDQNSPDHPDYDRHILNRDALRDYWGNVALLTPNHRDDILPFTLSIMNRTIDLGGGRLAPQVKTAVAALNRMSHFARAWNSKATVTFEPAWKAAIASHGVKWNNLTDNDLRRVSLRYDLHFQELSNLNQYRHGGLALGDKSMTGWTVTKEDMALLQSEKMLGEQALEIVQRVDRQVTEDSKGLPAGHAIYRKAVPVSQYTLPRMANRDRVGGLQPISAAYKAHAASATPESLHALSIALEATWFTDGNALLKQRNPDFSKPTIFDGQGGALEAIAAEIQNGRIFRTFDDVVNRISDLSGEPIDSTRNILASEFGRILSHFVTEVEGQTDPHKTVRVTGDEPTNSFTEARGAQLGPWTLYKTGWSNSDDVRAHAAAMVSVVRHRVEQGLRAQLADLKRARNEFVQRQRELEQAGKSNPKSAALTENRTARRRGEAFDQWFMFEHRIGALENRIKEIDDSKTQTRSEVSRVIARYMSGVTRVLIGSFPTTFRNTGAIYPFRTIYAMGSNGWRSFLGGIGIGTAQALKMIGSFVWSALKSVLWTPWKGILSGLLHTARGKGISQLWKRVVRAFVEEYGRTAILRIKDVKEMADAGAYLLPDSVNEYDNAVADALYHGIPRQDLSRAAKIALAPMAALESTFLAVISSGNPTIGDAVTNSTFWKFLNSSIGPAAQFKRKALALKTRIDAGNYPRSFDLQNPTAAANRLDPNDLNLTADELSRWRKSFNDAGLGSFDAKIIDYVNRLKTDPKQMFLSREQTVKLANWGIDSYNRSNASNTPGVLRGNNPLIEFIRPLQNWPTRALASFLDYMSVPSKVGAEDTSESRLRLNKMAQWTGKLATSLLIGTMAIGALSELTQEVVVRGYKRIFYHQEANNRWPWEHETPSKQVQALARYGLQSVPLLAIPINQVMPQNSPARASFDPSFVMLEKAKDMVAWISYGTQTGNWWYKTPATVTGFYQDAKIVTTQLDSQSGLNSKRNAESLVKHYGPEDLAKGGGAHAAPANLTPLTPYGQRLINAVYNGDHAEVMNIAREAMTVARQIGKADPRGAVEQMFYNGNFMHTALNQLPSESQYKKLYSKLNDSELKELKAAELNYTRAAQWLGFPTPHFFKPDEKVAQSLRREQPPIGTQRSLSRYR